MGHSLWQMIRNEWKRRKIMLRTYRHRRQCCWPVFTCIDFLLLCLQTLANTRSGILKKNLCILLSKCPQSSKHTLFKWMCFSTWRCKFRNVVINTWSLLWPLFLSLFIVCLLIYLFLIYCRPLCKGLSLRDIRFIQNPKGKIYTNTLKDNKVEQWNNSVKRMRHCQANKNLNMKRTGQMCNKIK